ncbi:MAG: outer membrane protein assembly factor BamA [Spirochaetota bacterium]
MKMKPIAMIMILTILCIFPAFAQDNGSTQDTNTSIEGLTIQEIIFEGVEHADTETLEDVKDGYIGRQFSTDLFEELKDEINSLPFFSYYSATANRTGEQNEQLVLTFTVTERPLIQEVIFDGNSVLDDGDLEDLIQSEAGGFLQNSVISSDREAIVQEYLERGYTNSSVGRSIERNEDENTAVVTFEITEGKQSRIDEIQFTGNESYSSNSLRRQIESKEQSLFNKGEFSEDNIQKDIQAIKQYYGQRGYVDAEVSHSVETVESDDDSKNLITLTYDITEGKQWRFGGLTVEGNTIFTDERIENRLTLSKGDILDIEKLQRDISKIADLYWNEGYIYNDIEPVESRNQQEQTISYTLRITERDQARIEDIVIRGNEKTKDYVLYRELTVEEGDIFSKEDFVQSVQNLYNTGIISNVDYNVLLGSQEGLIVLEFVVEESNRIDLQFGATFGGTDDFPISGFLSWTDKNFTGRGQDLEVSMNVASSSQTLDFSFEESWLAGRRWNGGFNFSAGHKNNKSVLMDQEAQRFDKEDYFDGTAVPDPFDTLAEYQKALKEDGNAAVGSEYLMEYEEWELSLGFNTGYTFHTDAGRIGINGGANVGLTRVDYDKTLYGRPFNPLVRDNYHNWQFNNRMNLSFQWDGRDLIQNTTQGFLFENSTTYAGGVLGGSRNYIRNKFGASGFFTLAELSDDELNPRNIVFSARTTFSSVLPQFFIYDDGGFGLRSQPIATQSEKLYIDGMTMVRGLDGPIYNLEHIWDTIFDVTIPIVPDILAGEVFFSATKYQSDWKDTFDYNNFFSDNFYLSTGAGIKLTIPGFPLGLYLTKVMEFDDDNTLKPLPGDGIFDSFIPENGLNLVFAITYRLY